MSKIDKPVMLLYNRERFCNKTQERKLRCFSFFFYLLIKVFEHFNQCIFSNLFVAAAVKTLKVKNVVYTDSSVYGESDWFLVATVKVIKPCRQL
jgi:hypothetical protein